MKDICDRQEFLFFQIRKAKKALLFFFNKASRKNVKNAKKVLFASFFRARFSSFASVYLSCFGDRSPRQLRYTDVGLRPWVYNVAARIRNLREEPSPGVLESLVESLAEGLVKRALAGLGAQGGTAQHGGRERAHEPSRAAPCGP